MCNAQARGAEAAADEIFAAEQSAAAAKESELQQLLQAALSEKEQLSKDVEAGRAALQVKTSSSYAVT